MAISGVTQDFIVKNGSIILGTNAVTSSTEQTGALQVNGGAAIAKNIIVGTTATIYGDTGLQGLLDVQNTATFYSDLNVTGTTALSGLLTVASTTTAAIDGSGAVSVTGGVYVGDNLIVMSTASSTATSSTNALIVEGGAWIGGTLVVEGDTIFQNAVTFNGTATYVLSTNTYYTDNILELHIPEGGPAAEWDFDDERDIGLRFHYYNTTSQNAALVFAHDSRLLEWYVTGAEGATTFSDGIYGGMKFGSLVLVDSTANDNTSTNTGALQVGGGVGIGGAVYAGGTINASGVYARNLTSTGTLVYSDLNGQLQNSTIHWNTGTTKLEGTITNADTSTNIAGGYTGDIPIQVSPGVTAFIPLGDEGSVLIANTSTATWASLSSLNSGLATTATNLAGGTAGSIPFQSDIGITGFDGTQFYYSNSGTTTATLTVPNLILTSDIDASSTGTGALQVTGGAYVSKSLFVGTTTEATSTGTGAISIAGGAYLGGNLYVTSTSTLLDRILFQDAPTTNLTVGAPTFLGNTDRITVFDNNSAVTNNYAIGYEDLNLWFSLGNSASTSGFKFYDSGSIELLKISGDGYVTVNSAYTLPNADGTTDYALITSGTGTVNWAAIVNSISVGTDTAISTSTGAVTIWNTSTLQSVTDRGSTSSNKINLTDSTPSLGTYTSGALTVDGGVGIAKDLVVGTTATIGGDLYVEGMIYVEGVGIDTISSTTGTFFDIVSSGTIYANVITATTLTVTGTTSVENITLSTGTATNFNVTGLFTATTATITSELTVGPVVTNNVVPAIYSNNVLLASYTSGVITGSDTVNLDQFDSSLYRTARYTVQVLDVSDVHITEITLFHNDVDVYKNEYGTSTNNGILGRFDAILTDTTVVLTFEPISATAMTIKVVRLGITT